MNLKDKNILLGVSGGIAVYKVLDLCSRLKKRGANLKIIMTDSACEFVTPLSFETMGKCKVYNSIFKGHHDEVFHIELPKWADIMLIAPATANILAKFSNGIADDMLSTTFLACTKPVIVAPAMNTNMLMNVSVQENILKLKQRGIHFIESKSGLLACNTVGDGRLAEPEEIVDYLEIFFSKKDLKGKKIIVTAGPTVADIDFVRYITNKSSGKMGYNIAKAARDRGADVYLISGPVEPFKIEGITTIKIRTNEQLKDSIETLFSDSNALIMSAAPVDYKPENYFDKKIKKNGQTLKLNLIQTDDILKYFGDKKTKQKIIAFAAETDDVIDNALKKLHEKNADFIVANDLKMDGAGFNTDTNIATIISEKDTIKLNKMSKYELANKILDLI
ncbi:MAG: bifunctional phosphopantothenoylcysteine decarboxylase/phosphopantothenate--cysteine ligase CoaBC [Peptoniphilaceae bacterium]|nr:bifunctional phosphopantothenoylcysteine decarboxylase/phosphopantothenate--cysteine ligase CoaBC [Peptoniphilaceae bacterium]MDD7383783.1 bifunctional phosphopantothenoylcysteine decarboxylase/phosphopantothenate--cysteine ligase CoaBC [Peptoniphilaceae bacterium]MDY3738111.1 bifunctional phosphopantothenoylcysteine decarboxylase/phosphopantothenate--cysteine ligase CoaBC [Peptoniphilaceae bacterium]